MNYFKITFKNLLFITLFVGLIASCSKKDDPTPKPEPPEDILFEASVSDFTVDAGGTLSFTDESTGVQSREWTFPGGSVATSSEASVDVSFAKEGPITVNLEVTFIDGTSETKDFPIQVGTEQLAWINYSFEHDDNDWLLEKWFTWSSASGEALDVSTEGSFTIEESDGAEGTSKSGRFYLETPTADAWLQLIAQPGFGIRKFEREKSYTFSFWAKSDIDVVITAAVENPELKDENEENVIQPWNNYLWADVALTAGDGWKEFTFLLDEKTQEAFTNNPTLDEFKELFLKFQVEAFVSNAYNGNIWLDEFSIKEN